MSGAAAAISASGGGGISVNFPDQNEYGSAVSPADATASYVIQSNGTPWLLSGLNSDVEILATLSSGTLTSGNVATWQVPTSNLTWTVTRTLNAVGSNAASLSFLARKVVDGVALAGWTVTITAEVT